MKSLPDKANDPLSSLLKGQHQDITPSGFTEKIMAKLEPETNKVPLPYVPVITVKGWISIGLIVLSIYGMALFGSSTAQSGVINSILENVHLRSLDNFTSLFSGGTTSWILWGIALVSFMVISLESQLRKRFRIS